MQPLAAHPVPEASFDTHGYQLFRQAEAGGSNLAAHKLPTTFPAFLDFTKKQLIRDHPDLVSLLKVLRRQPPPEFGQLVEFVESQMTAAGLCHLPAAVFLPQKSPAKLAGNTVSA